MAEKVLTIRLRVQDDGSVVLDRAGKAVDKLAASEANAAAEARRATAALQQQTNALAAIDGKVTSATQAVKAFFAAWIVREAVGGMVSLVRQGVEFNALMQTSRLGIAALVSGLGEIRSASGEVLRGQERWNAAMVISGELQKQARIAALQTKAEYTDIIRLLQVGLGPMLAAGITDSAKIIKLVQAVAQTGGALGLPGVQLPQEIRALMQGEKGPHNLIANVLLGDIPKEKFDQMRQAGKLYDFLIERMAAFAKAGEESTKTFDTALSNLKDAIGQALGESTQGATDQFTQSILNLTGAIVSFDSAGKPIFNPEFIASVRAVAEAFAAVAKFAGDAALALPTIIESYKQFDAAARSNARSKTAIGLNMVLPGLGEWYKIDKTINDARALATFDDQQQFGRERYLNNLGRIRRASGLDTYATPIGPQPLPALSGPPKQFPLTREQNDQLRKLQTDYLLQVEEFRAKALAAGDPLKEALIAIESERKKKISDLKLQQEKMEEAIGAPKGFLAGQFAPAIGAVNTLARERGGQAIYTVLYGDEFTKSRQASARARQMLEQDEKATQQIRIQNERETTDAILAIRKSQAVTTRELIDVELEEQLEANQRELDDAAEKYGVDSQAFAAAIAIREKKDKEAFAKAAQLRKQDTVGTKEWADKVRETVQRQIGDLPSLVTNAVISSRLAATGEIEKFLDDVIDGNANALRSLEDLGKNVGKTWAHVIAGILTNGKGAKQQLNELWKDLGAQGTGDRMLAGAGIGAFVGGFAPKGSQGQNAAMLGGSIGGFFGPIGAVVGAVLGAALGAMIQKGKDWINVAIATSVKGDLIVGVTEKGISAEARGELETQVRRRVKDTMKSWQQILDMLPEEMRAELAKMPKPSLDIHGGVEASDIRDETALNSLQDFLGNKMPKEVFAAYHGSIEKALQLLGADTERIKQLFEYWGTLQGSELHDAVERFFKAVIVANDFKGKFDKLAVGGDAFYHPLREAAMGRSPLQQIQDINGQMAMIAASMTKMTDIEDLTAAQERLNALSEQRYNMSIAAEQEILNLRKQQIEQNTSLAEQIKLAGMGDQEKLNYFYAQINNLRTDLTHATDPKQIAEIEGRLRQYIQAAFGLAPGNEENRNKLLGILQWMTDIGEGRFGLAENDITKEDQKAASMLQEAADALLKAAQALAGGGEKPKPEPPGPGKPKEPPDKKDYADVAIGLKSFSDSVVTAADDLRHLHDWGGPPDLKEMGRTIAAAVREALSNLTVINNNEITVPIDANGLVSVSVSRSVSTMRAELRRNPDSFVSRSG